MRRKKSDMFMTTGQSYSTESPEDINNVVLSSRGFVFGNANKRQSRTESAPKKDKRLNP